MNIIDRLNQYLYEAEIDWGKVKESAVNAAKDIFDEPDLDIIADMIDDVKKKGKAKDTEDAIQIVINMMRSD